MDLILAKLEVSQLGWALFTVVTLTVVRLLWTGTLVTGRQLDRELKSKDDVIADLRADNVAWKDTVRDTARELAEVSGQNARLVGQLAPAAVSVITALPDVPNRLESPS